MHATSLWICGFQLVKLHFTQIEAIMPMLQLLLVHAGTSTQLWIILEYHPRGSLYS